MATVIGVLAAFWGTVMAVAPGLQIRRMMIRRSSEDLSLGYFGVLLPGFALWMGYGWIRADWALVVPNTIAIIVALATVAVGLLLRRHGSGHAEREPHSDRPRCLNPGVGEGRGPGS
jgi:MtN3 and saliva related transmembrane protein